MKKSGFTLAEILITLSIIGVVASLTAPALLQDASNAKTGPALEKTKSAIELANQNILFQNRATDLLAIRLNGNQLDEDGYLRLLAQNFQNSTFLPANSPQGALSFNFTGRAGQQQGTRAWNVADWNGEGDSDPNNGTAKLILADNVTISVDATNPNPAGYTNFANNGNIGRKGSYRGPLANLLIDLNGVTNGPNTFGRDIFFFTVDRSGVVIPDGSKLFYHENRNGQQNRNPDGYMTWNNGVNEPRPFPDRDDYFCTADRVTTGRGCAGSILDNGRRVTYR